VKKTILTMLALAFVGGLVATDSRGQTAPPADQPVYTICTLIVGSRTERSAPLPPVAAGALNGPVELFTGSSKPLKMEDALKLGENITDLHDKLKGSFQLDQIETAGSLGDWLPVGHEMSLQGRSADVKLIVTLMRTEVGAEPPFVAALPESGAEAPGYERGYAAALTTFHRVAAFHVRLTAGSAVLFNTTMRVQLGSRSVFARQPAPGGPLYFVALSAPRPAGTPVSSAVLEPSRQIRAPRVISGPDPGLTPEARAAGRKGPVVLTATIGKDGVARNIKVVTAVEGLTELAVKALEQRRYEPARDENGNPIVVQVAVWLPFRDEPEEEQGG